MARSSFAVSVCPLVELMTSRGREAGKGFVEDKRRRKGRGKEEKRREKRRNSNAANTAIIKLIIKITSQQ